MKNLLKQFIKEQLSIDVTCACALIVADDRKVLSVSRKDDPTMLGLVGGKIDLGETAEEACKREVKEETGLTVTSMRRVFSGTDDDGNEVVTFACEVEGSIHTDEVGVIRWVDWTLLCDPEHTLYSEYNSELFASMGWT